MPAVLVHGVPDTHRLWRALAARLRRADVIPLSLPDFGGLLVVRAVSLEPALVRTWAAGAAPLDPEYEWHKAAQLWQTPGVGEQVMEKLTPEVLGATLAAADVPDADATTAAAQLDDPMKRSILALYRSAIRVGFEWVDDLQRAPARGLILWGENDPYAAPEFGRRLADRTRARFVPFAGCSHWWQLERAGEVANELEAHWR